MTRQTLTIGILLAIGCNKPGARTSSTQVAAPVSVVTAGVDGRVAVRVDGEGYHPGTIRAQAGRALVLVFRRTTDETCGTQVRVPSMNLQRDLPLNTDVEVTVTVPPSGALAFSCGMNMFQGSVVAQ